MSDTAAGTYEIRWAEDKDWIPAMHMIWKTFLKFEAVDYTEEGIRNFYDFITDEPVSYTHLTLPTTSRV